MWQSACIFAVVVLAAGYVSWAFLPLKHRQRLLDGLAARGVFSGWAARHRAQMATPGCHNCSAAGTHALPDQREWTQAAGFPVRRAAAADRPRA